MAIKLIALDLDGTTLNSKGELTEYTRETLKKAMRQNIHVVIATGRAYVALPNEILDMEGIEYIITSNGAAIIELEKRTLIYENCIAEEEIEEIYKFLKQYDFLVEVFIKGKAYAEKSIMAQLENSGLKERSITYIRKTRIPTENVLELMRENCKDIENINVIFGKPEDKEAMQPKLLELKNVTITSSIDHNLEIGGATTSKATALLELCKELGVKKEEILACGDSPNDEEMMKVAGIAVAMGNGKPSVQEIANYITSTNDEEGVALAIEKFALV